MRQIYENNESTLRQYALKDKLIAYGWPADKIITIDQDLGKSGTDSTNRDGFQMLVGEVSNNLVGAVACIECSRLSRSSADWGRLTKFCALTNTLLIDADGIYDPNDFNDRLLLGLKATISEAEIHFLQERMRGGLINKAKRGELKRPIPIGYIYDDDRVIKDPDMEVQNAVEMLFDAFRRTGSAHGAVKHFKAKGYKFPYKIGKGFRKGDVEWIDMGFSHALNILHNPFYAGVYFYGKYQRVWTSEGKKTIEAPRKDWHIFIRNHHEAYIPFDEFEANEQIISENRTQRKSLEKKTPPREGPALIQGLVWCGKCGRRMSVQYNHRNGQLIPVYKCDNAAVHHGGDPCQYITGDVIDSKISELLVNRLTPEVIEQAVSVQKELDHRQEETLNYYQMRVEKCRYDAELARKRFMNVDPDNRLVALELESSWNLKLNALDDARKEYDSQMARIERGKNERDYKKVENLADNFSEIFQSKTINYKDKKRMVRYLIEDVTLTRIDVGVQVQIRFKGYTTQSFVIDAPLKSYEGWTTNPEVIKIIDEAAESHIAGEIADLLNQQGFRSGKGQNFTPNIVKRIMYDYSIPNMKERYLDRGYIISSEKAALMGITTKELMYMIRSGKYQNEYIRVNSRNDCVFPPEQNCEVCRV